MRDLTKAQRQALFDCITSHDACARVKRPYGGQWGEFPNDIDDVRLLESEGILRFVSLHRAPDGGLVRCSTITRAGLDAIDARFVLGKPPKGFDVPTCDALDDANSEGGRP